MRENVYHKRPSSYRREGMLSRIEHNLRRLIIAFILLTLLFLAVVEVAIPDVVL
jgi:hypothetical protein